PPMILACEERRRTRTPHQPSRVRAPSSAKVSRSDDQEIEDQAETKREKKKNRNGGTIRGRCHGSNYDTEMKALADGGLPQFITNNCVRIARNATAPKKVRISFPEIGY